MNIRTKRVYETTGPDDGYRILVDRIWPRGVTKRNASIDIWMKEAGPSTELRRWFGHDTARWHEFKRRYSAELDERHDLLRDILMQARSGPVTLVYSARDTNHNQAVVLADYLASIQDS